MNNTLTQEQKKKVLEEYVGDDRAKLVLNGFSLDVESSEMLDSLNAAFALGVAQEREACAKVCEDAVKQISPFGFIEEERRQGGINTCVNLASAIRARK
jgi:hypothetical protein